METKVKCKIEKKIHNENLLTWLQLAVVVFPNMPDVINSYY